MPFKHSFNEKICPHIRGNIIDISTEMDYLHV